MVLKEEKEDPKVSVTNLFKDSMITGIPQIVSAKNWKKKLIRSFIFLFCFGGFIYQTFSYLNIYWKYETVVDVQMESPLMGDKPSFTICSYAGFKSVKYCKDFNKTLADNYYLEICEELSHYSYIDDACKCTPRLCDESNKPFNLSFPSMVDYRTLHSLPPNFQKQYMATEKDYVYLYEEKDLYPDKESTGSTINPYPMEIPCAGSLLYHSACFTRNSLIKKPDAKPDKVYSRGKIAILLNTLNQQTPPMIEIPTLSISVHSPNHVVNPFRHGVYLEIGALNRIRISKVVKARLPYPYETDCRDYLTTWKQRGGIGPVNSKECIQECMRNYSMATWNCVWYGIDYPGLDSPPCLGYRQEDFTLVGNCQECFDSCKPACYEELYHVKSDVKELKKLPRCGKRGNLSKWDFVGVEIELNGLETTVYKSRPSYESVEIFSYIGGFIGIWLGISLIAVFDFVETVALLIKYYLRKICMLRKKNRIQNVNDE